MSRPLSASSSTSSRANPLKRQTPLSTSYSDFETSLPSTPTSVALPLPRSGLHSPKKHRHQVEKKILESALEEDWLAFQNRGSGTKGTGEREEKEWEVLVVDSDYEERDGEDEDSSSGLESDSTQMEDVDVERRRKEKGKGRETSEDVVMVMQSEQMTEREILREKMEHMGPEERLSTSKQSKVVRVSLTSLHLLRDDIPRTITTLDLKVTLSLVLSSPSPNLATDTSQATRTILFTRSLPSSPKSTCTTLVCLESNFDLHLSSASIQRTDTLNLSIVVQRGSVLFTAQFPLVTSMGEYVPDEESIRIPFHQACSADGSVSLEDREGLTLSIRIDDLIPTLDLGDLQRTWIGFASERLEQLSLEGADQRGWIPGAVKVHRSGTVVMGSRGKAEVRETRRGKRRYLVPELGESVAFDAVTKLPYEVGEIINAVDSEGISFPMHSQIRLRDAELLQLDLPPDAITIKRLHSRFCLLNTGMSPPVREHACWSHWAPIITYFKLETALWEHLSTLVQYNVLSSTEALKVVREMKRSAESAEEYWDWRERLVGRRKKREQEQRLARHG